MFLSKVSLKQRSGASHRVLCDLYAQHRMVLSAFPDRSDGDAAEVPTVLYRIESQPLRGALYLLVQSELTPDWEKARNLHPGVIEEWECKEFRPLFRQGDRFRFRLRANPTKAIIDARQPERQRSKRIGIYAEAGQREWLQRTAERCGFAIDPAAVQTVPRGKLEGEKPGNAPVLSGNVQCFMADFDGLLTITDAGAFERAWRTGVGRGRAWGCGLLSLARA